MMDPIGAKELVSERGVTGPDWAWILSLSIFLTR